MIIWLASYPKSGNTFLRSLLVSYFHTKKGKFDFNLLKNIEQFPDSEIFKKIGIDINDKYQVSKNYIRVQEEINKDNKLKFFKTHSSFCKMYNEFNFSDLKNSLGVIYIVRDPRNIISSFANHNSQSIENTFEVMSNDLTIGNEKNDLEVYLGSWNFNYNSWKIYQSSGKYLLVKYEDLVSKTNKIFTQILEFVQKVSHHQFLIDKNKIEKVVDATIFSKMQNLEKKYGFDEAKLNDSTGKKVKFFNLGPKNDWRNILDNKIKKKIENKFSKEMQELGYL